ncbi:RNA binding protein fox-1 homolog 2-like isoform X2 [Tubulanus polymorphus]|uniref:RNA binding protein fox-1 homolog 2-like isoform X2 n=1 Tax=Tubulanus polymorphus TaxID=672921 RepID=UPI003DA5BF46
MMDFSKIDPHSGLMHMVQNQMPPTYQQFPTPGLEEAFQQQTQAAAAAVAAASVAPPQSVVAEPQQPQQQQQAPPPFAVVKTDSQQQPAQQQPFTTQPCQSVTPNGVEQQTVSNRQTDLESEVSTSPTTTTSTTTQSTGPKRLHVSNIPFRFREADLRNLLGFGPILDVEIIFNERGSKGFGFVTFQNSADADRAREKLNGTVVEGRKIEVNNATARVMTKKNPTPTVPTAVPTDVHSAYALALQQSTEDQQRLGCESPPNGQGLVIYNSLLQPQFIQTAALRGAAIRGRMPTVATRGAYTAATAAALRHPSPLAAATALPYAPGVYQDPFLAATYTDRYQPFAAAAAAAGGALGTVSRYAIPTVAAAPATYAVAGYPGREYATDPYLGHSIGPVPGYSPTVYRGGYQRFAPY